MFDFIKKLKLQEDIYGILQTTAQSKLSVREQALRVFSNIEGLDDIKEMMLRALELINLHTRTIMVIGTNYYTVLSFYTAKF